MSPSRNWRSQYPGSTGSTGRGGGRHRTASISDYRREDFRQTPTRRRARVRDVSTPGKFHTAGQAGVHRYSHGLTLLELLVVLAITALLTTIGVPSFREYVQNQRLKAAVAAFHSDLVRARAEAVHRVQRIVVCPATAAAGCLDAPEWDKGWRVFADLNGDREHQGGEPVLRQAPPVEFLTIRSAARRGPVLSGTCGPPWAPARPWSPDT